MSFLRQTLMLDRGDVKLSGGQGRKSGHRGTKQPNCGVRGCNTARARFGSLRTGWATSWHPAERGKVTSIPRWGTGPQEARVTCLRSEVGEWCALLSTRLCLVPNIVHFP